MLAHFSSAGPTPIGAALTTESKRYGAIIPDQIVIDVATERLHPKWKRRKLVVWLFFRKMSAGGRLDSRLGGGGSVGGAQVAARLRRSFAGGDAAEQRRDGQQRHQ